MTDFQGKVALVTGGGSGIGRACCQLFSERGATVAIADVNVEGAEQVAAEVEAAGGRALALALDVTNPDQVGKQLAVVADKLGRLDALVNSAGISTTHAPAADFPIADWQRAIDINLSGTFYVTRAAIPLLLASGGGAVVNIASIMGQVASAGGSAYTATKHAVIGLAKAIALDYAQQNIRVNAVGPGVIETPMTQIVRDMPEVSQALMAGTPMGRFGQPREVAQLIVFLCSDAASFITAAYYPVDGGYLAQ